MGAELKAQTQRLTNQNIDLLVAKLEGVEVEIYKSRDGQEFVAQRLPFSPEGPANVFPSDHSCMFRFYQPTKDWELAGPIIEKERICVMYSDKSNGEEPYSWAYYPDDDGDDVLHECDGNTGPEAAMRSFVAKHFGSTIDLQTLPKIERTAIVKVDGWSRGVEELIDVSEEEFLAALFSQEIEVIAETSAEAERKAKEMHDHLEDVDAYFLRWQ
jgi:hypothetical protein